MIDDTAVRSSLPSQSSSSLDNSPWIISIRQEMNEAQQYESSSNWKTQTIYRVPKILRELDDAAYTPQIVSLGPYHRGRPTLEEMNRHKWRALNHVLTRTGHDIRLYLGALRKLEDRARGCYEASLDISSDDFVKTLLLDSIFFLEIVRGVSLNKFPDDYDLHDPVFSIHSNIYSLQSDMILLENQLPLFVLDRILGLQDNHYEHGYVARLAFHFFHPHRLTDESFASSFFYRITFTDVTFESSNFLLKKADALHCLDVFRCSLNFPNQKQSSSNLELTHRITKQNPPSQLQLIRCVEELRKADIKFRRRKIGSFWDIKFDKGILQIPRICIERNTKSLLLNLMAFEMCHLDCSNYITSYIIFMDSLINSEMDVKYLCDKGIIKHWLGNDSEVADMFNQLTCKVTFDINCCYLSELYRQVDIYYNWKWNTWRASFIHRHLINPWTIISLVAAAVLLLLTFAQTFYSIYGYYKPRGS